MTEAKTPAPRKGKAAAASTAPQVEAAVPLPAAEPSVPLGAGVSPELLRHFPLAI